MKSLKWINTVACAVVLLPIGGNTTAQVSEAYPNLFTPAPITFAIWGVIYLMMALFVVYQWELLDRGRYSAKVRGDVGLWFAVSCALNIAWVFLWHYRRIGLSMIAIVLLLIGACIWAIFGRIDTSVPGIMQVSGGEAEIELYAEDAEKVRIGDSVKADGIEGIVSAMGDPDGDGRIELIVATEAEDGIYNVKIVTESVSAWSFIAN